MNCGTQLFKDESTSNLLDLFKSTIASKNVTPKYDYIFGPITSSAHLKMNPDPEANDFSFPKIVLNVIMEKLSIGLTKVQYQETMQLIEQFGRMSRAYPYRKYRPYGIEYRGHYKEWWKFAYNCILETEIKRRKLNWSWEHMKQTREYCRLYEVVYKKKITSKKPSQEVIDAVDMYERELNIQNLIIIRQKVELEVEKENKLIKEANSSRWFGGWFSSKNSDKDADNIKQKFEDAIQIELPENFVALRLHFSLNCLEISIKSDIENMLENVLLLQLNKVRCDVSQRPSAKSILFNLKLEELSVFGLQKNQYLPVMIQSQVESSHSLLDVMFESNPFDKNCDQRIKVQSQPIHFVYNADTIIELLKVFQTQRTETLSQ
jgi:vacuolar protein sorting-associated protein 13A/C